MPTVKVKYQLTIDPLLVLNQLEFENQEFVPVFTKGEDNTPDQTIFVDDSINIHLLTSGGPGSWTIAVWVAVFDESQGALAGEWKPCKNNGLGTFTGDDVNNELIGSFSIKWV